MASETDRKFWLGVLRGVFASQAKPAIRESKVTKRAVQLAAEKGHKGSKAERKAGLAAFVQQASAEKLIQVRDGRLALQPAAAAATVQPAKKRKLAEGKQLQAPPAAASQQQEQDIATPTNGAAKPAKAPGAAGKGAKRKRAAVSEEQQQAKHTQQAPLTHHTRAGTAVVLSQPAATAQPKKRKKKAAAAERPAQADGGVESPQPADVQRTGAAAVPSQPTGATQPKNRKQKSAAAEPPAQPNGAVEPSQRAGQNGTGTAAQPPAANGSTSAAKRKRKAAADAPDANTPAKPAASKQRRKAAAAADADSAADAAATPAPAKRRKKAAKDGTQQQPSPGTGKSPARMPAIGGAAAAQAPDGAEVDLSGNVWKAKRDKVKTGRFSAAEDAQIREAVNTYADAHGHSKDDLSWLYKVRGKGSQDAYGAWKDIASALPHRTVKSVYAHGTRVLHEGNYQGRWDAEEDAQLRELVETGGQKWKAIGAALGRIPEGCRDRWKEIRMGEQRRSGAWSEEEVRKLRDAVEEYLTLKQDHEAARREATLSFADISGAGAQPAAADGRLLLDDIDWGLISDKVGTRSNNQCLDKWYNQLCPSMVSKGEWGSGDDRRLLRALLLSGCSHDWETDWGGLVAGRTAGQARRRWRLMLKCVPDRADKDFLESLDFLVSTYCPGLKAKLEAAAAAAAEAE